MGPGTETVGESMLSVSLHRCFVDEKVSDAGSKPAKAISPVPCTEGWLPSRSGPAFPVPSAPPPETWPGSSALAGLPESEIDDWPALIGAPEPADEPPHVHPSSSVASRGWSKLSNRRQLSVSLRSSHRLTMLVLGLTMIVLAPAELNAADAIANPAAAATATAKT